MRKTAIITGSARGMGFETAKILNRNGYNVVLCARHSNDDVENFVKIIRIPFCSSLPI